MSHSPTAAGGPNPPLLQISQAVKMLGGWRALDGVDLDLYPGEILVLLGPNGAGKSTLLATACGRIALDSGEVRLAGQDPRRHAEVRSRLGFVPQHLAVYPYLSVRENLEVFGRMMGVSRATLHERVDEAIRWAGLADRSDAHCETLSGGMRRRLNIVASLLHHPDVVLLDEPTVGVDMSARERVHELLRRLRANGLAMLLTTHDLSQAEALADRVAVMLDGRICLQGSPSELIHREFDTRQELKIVLRDVPDDSGVSLLQELELKPAHGSITWSGPVSSDLAHVGELTSRLQQAGLRTAEVRVREACLEGVLLRATGEELRL
ncbi:MAG: ABC transporter ATP-binding protein [Gammaproteobacteria bacterium]|nr:ABC transporter ATP-binding protein [Gammaproteobacteria bacterium]